MMAAASSSRSITPEPSMSMASKIFFTMFSMLFPSEASAKPPVRDCKLLCVALREASKSPKSSASISNNSRCFQFPPASCPCSLDCASASPSRAASADKAAPSDAPPSMLLLWLLTLPKCSTDFKVFVPATHDTITRKSLRDKRSSTVVSTLLRPAWPTWTWLLKLSVVHISEAMMLACAKFCAISFKWSTSSCLAGDMSSD
mmetsp:Transcript_33568/g.61332  ORF Transcript_33568/g.61332 Transcript_33568/m.61332 type:complete len:202 (+) Transcript_33568:935-1540(+)